MFKMRLLNKLFKNHPHVMKIRKGYAVVGTDLEIAIMLLVCQRTLEERGYDGPKIAAMLTEHSRKEANHAQNLKG